MKKLLAILLVLVFCSSLISCGKTDKSEDEFSNISVEYSEEISDDESKEINDHLSEETSGDLSEEASGDASEDISGDASEDISGDESEDISGDASEDEFNLTPALYKAQNEKGNTVWLFGSIHLGDDRFYPLPEYVTEAFDSADALAVEFDVIAFQKDWSAMTSALSLMVYRDGTTIKDHVSAETYEAAKKILKDKNSYDPMLDYYMPCFWESTISSLFYDKIGVNTENGIDVTLINKANDVKKEIINIESAELQYGMMAGFSEELQEFLLKQTLDSYDQVAMGKLSVEMLKTTWASGDEKLISQVSLSSNIGSEQEKALYDEYVKAMLTDRNIGMADFAEEALNSESEVFVCVGAAHIVGEGGIVDLLRERGYLVERVEAE